MARPQKGRRPRRQGRQQQAAKSAYFVQPGKRGAVIVLRKPAGNRATPKVCGVMPSRVHAKMLITQLEKAESVVSDLFLEATDDGIEALEAVLAACRDEVLKRGPKTPPAGSAARSDEGEMPEGGTAPATADDANDAEA